MTEDLETLAKEVDALALAHVNQFWSCYGLELPFAVEHKFEHFFVGAAFWDKAHYAMDLVKSCYNKYTKEATDRHFIIRGARYYSQESGLRMSPVYQLLSNILDGSDEFPEDLSYDHFHLLRIPEYSQIQKSSKDTEKKSKRPGDEMVESRIKRFNNIHFPCFCVDEYLSRFNRKTVKTVKGEKQNVQFFEKYGSKGIAYVHQMMMQDRLK